LNSVSLETHMDYFKEVDPIMRELRPLLLKHWGTIDVHHTKSESATDVVTELDIEIEQIVKEKLSTLDPTIEFVGEECGGNRKAERQWLMDPIDGTGHFIRGLPFATVMIALIENGVVTFSAIYDFVNDHLYVARRGKGSFMNGTPIHVSSRDITSSYYVIETDLKKQSNFEVFQKLLKKRGGRLNLLCAGWIFAMVACGKMDAYIGFDPFGKDYDYAPGCLLVAEAGGTVRNVGKDTYDYRDLNFIAANPTVYHDLTQGPDAIFPNLEKTDA
jgi:myo-inositol-1(or 4)-monophosphatase